MERLWMDVRQTWRAWRRMPSVALAIIVLLALGIGGVAALFSPLYSLLLAPLPFPHSDQLVRIGGNIPVFNAYSSTFEERERLRPIFSNVMAYAPLSAGVHARFLPAGQPKSVNVQTVTPEFFETIGVSPRMGSGFAKEGVHSSAVVLSDRLWRVELQSARDVIGSTIWLVDLPRTVVGVMPKDFNFPADTDLWVPMGTAPVGDSSIQFVGRLRAGMSVGQAATTLKAVGYKHGEGPSGKIGKDGPVLQSLQVFLRGDQRPLLWLLWAVSILFLLLACAGVGNLLLSQGVRRRPEMVMRLALGAGRWRLVRQLLTETLLVVVAGGLLGMWLSTIAGRWLQMQLAEMQGGQIFVPATIPLVVALAVAVTIICGLAPALHATGADLCSSIKSRGSGTSVFKSSRRLCSFREFLAGVQVALALVLLIGTGLLLRSLTTRVNVPLGLETRNVTAFLTALPRLPEWTAARAKFYQQNNLDFFSSGRRGRTFLDNLARRLEPEQRAENARNLLFFREAQHRLRELPGVVSLGILDPTPFTSEVMRAIQDPVAVYKSNPRGAELQHYATSIVGRASTSAFDVLGIDLLAGRTFTVTDVAGEQARESNEGRGVAIINEALARSFWPNENAIGKQFYGAQLEARTVVGIVSNFHQSGYNMSVMPAVYYPFTGMTGRGSFVAKLRSGATMKQFAADVNRVLAELAPYLPRVEVQNMQDLSERSMTNLRLALILLSCFSLLGTVVAGLGVYAAATLMAAARTGEMGIRMALGACAQQIRWLALWRSVRLAVVAFPAGLLAGWALARSLSHFMFQVGAIDLMTYVTSSALILIIVLAAGLRPALRAAFADPAAVLRHD